MAGKMNAEKARQDAVDVLKSVTPLSVRKRVVKARLSARRATAAGRSLPDFLILGGQRCGTSSLYKYLGRHPNVAPSLRKEIEYFTIEYGRGESWYRAHFPLETRRMFASFRGRPFATFEATPDYLFDPRAPERVETLVPDAKFVVILRDPIERAISHYHHNVRLGLEDLSFRDAIAAEDERLARDRKALREDPYDRVLNFRRYSYVSRGRYVEQLARWFDVSPRGRFLILMSDDLFARPEETLYEILRFVGVPMWSPPEFRNYSYAKDAVAGSPEIPDGLRHGLDDRFAGPNRELAQLLGFTPRWM